jgi:Tfp pilus assembly protein PilF
VSPRLWQQRAEVLPRAGSAPGDLRDRMVREDLLDLGYFWSNILARRAAQGDAAAARIQAELLRGVAEIGGPHPAATYEQARASGQVPPLLALDSASLWECCALARAMIQHDDLERVEPVLRAAEEKQAKREQDDRREARASDFPWATFYRGIAAQRRGDHRAALGAFSECIGRMPLDPSAARQPECYYLRALSYEALGDGELAFRDLDKALELQKGFATGLLTRGLWRLQRQEIEGALADLRQAAELGAEPARTQCYLALAYLARHDGEAARRCVARALQADPTDAVRALDRLLRRELPDEEKK